MSDSKPPPSEGGKKRRSLADPFSDRDNFPSLDDALRLDVDQSPSMCSQSSANLSIGTRAALNEHLRYVAKHGIDASHVEDDEQPDRTSHTSPENSLDRQWERLVDGNLSQFSSASFQNSSSDRTEYILSTEQDGEEAVEVMTDLSTDYFNSSRINLLRTPEKYLSRKVEAVTTRKDANSEDESFSTTDHSLEKHSHVSPFFRDRAEEFFHEAPPPDSSFACLSAVDVSRISALDVSHISTDGSDALPRRSPNAASAKRNAIDEEMEYFLPPLYTSPNNHIGDETTTTARRRPRRLSLGHVQPPLFPSSLSPRKGLRREKENTSNETVSFDSLRLSPISGHTESSRAAAHTAMLTEQPVSDAADYFSNLESSAIKEDMSGSAESAQGYQHHHLSSVEIDTMAQESDISTIRDPSSSAKNTSSSSSSWMAHHNQALVDRRRYRTVVPSRVFMKDASEFPEHYDSFSAPLPRISKLVDGTGDRSSQSDPTA